MNFQYIPDFQRKIRYACLIRVHKEYNTLKMSRKRREKLNTEEHKRAIAR